MQRCCGAGANDRARSEATVRANSCGASSPVSRVRKRACIHLVLQGIQGSFSSRPSMRSPGRLAMSSLRSRDMMSPQSGPFALQGRLDWKWRTAKQEKGHSAGRSTAKSSHASTLFPHLIHDLANQHFHFNGHATSLRCESLTTSALTGNPTIRFIIVPRNDEARHTLRGKTSDSPRPS